MKKMLLVLTLFVLLLPLSAVAATLNVPGSYATIAAAVIAASNDDIIELAAGTYTGPGNYNVDFSGKWLSVQSATNDPATCIIDCEKNGRAFLIHHGESVTLIGLTLKNGEADVDNGGGAVYCIFSDFGAIDCIFSGNHAGGVDGGAVFLFHSYSFFENCTFTSNSTDLYGGAVDLFSSDSFFLGCTFTSNSAVSGGGAVHPYDSSFLVFANCTFTSNRARSGGAVYSFYYNDNTISSGPILENCIFNLNRARFGGAVYSYNPFSLNITNCTFTQNQAADQGGALWCSISLASEEDLIKLKNCILWGDTAPEGVEIYEEQKPLVITYSDIGGGTSGRVILTLTRFFCQLLLPTYIFTLILRVSIVERITVHPVMI